MTDTAPHIGTLRERPLHAALKRWSAEPGDRFEVRVGSYVVDIVRDDLLIEIQTRGFSSMKTKLRRLLEDGHRIRIVYPVIAAKWICKLDADGVVSSRRKSPQKGAFTDVFAELVSFPSLLDHDGLEIEVLAVHVDELRRHEPGKAWRRKGWVVEERRLIGVIDGIVLRSTADALELLPDDLPDPFTTGDVADRSGMSRRLAQQAMYCLRESGAIPTDGKRGNAVLYRIP